MGIDCVAEFGRNGGMKNLCCFALLLAGCHTVRPARTRYSPEPPTPPRRVALEEPPSAAAIPPASTVLPPAGTIVRPPVIDIETRISAVNGALEDAYFDYDRSDLAQEAVSALRRDAALLCTILADFPALKIVLEGHCDERGSAEYNLGLGERRARRAEDVLRENGVPAAAVEIVSYGKEAPQCTEPTEACYQRNRRAHIAVKR